MAKLSWNQNVLMQLRFGAIQGVNATAVDARKEVERSLPRVFDRPTRFTQRGVAVIRANRSRPRARVLIKDRQAAYLARQEVGGTRLPRGRALIVPVRARRNQFGNLSRNAFQRLLARPDTFSGEVRGIGGLWQRTRQGGLKLLIAYEQRAEYEPRFGFRDTVRRTVIKRLARNIRVETVKAFSSAR